MYFKNCYIFLFPKIIDWSKIYDEEILTLQELEDQNKLKNDKLNNDKLNNRIFILLNNNLMQTLKYKN